MNTCPICKKDFPRASTGRNGIYCSDAHKMRAYRQRKLLSVTKAIPSVTKLYKPVTKCKGCTPKSKFCSTCDKAKFGCIC